MERKTFINTLVTFIITGFQAFITVFIMEWIYRGSFEQAYYWFIEYTKPFTYSFIFLFLLFAAIRLFKRKLVILFSVLITIPLFLLALASRIKQGIRGEPVLPSDLFLGSEATNMLDLFSSSLLIWIIIGCVCFLLLVGFIIYKVPNQKKMNMLTILIASSMLLTLLVLFSIERNKEDSFLKQKLNIVHVAWDSKATYLHDGLLAGFVLNLKWLTIEEPEGYSKESINKIKEKIETPLYEESNKPNIIMIMSEAFWDPTVLDGVTFNQDPLPFFRQLQEEHTAGTFNVPVFGGSTVNTEFEALTGMSTQFTPPGSIPYLNYVKKPLPALPNILRQYGYETTAIHTYHNWFYQRTAVFEHLGFDRFIPLEFIENPIPDKNYAFIKDQSITDEILKKLEMNDQNNPQFIFAVTTQNHGPYGEDEETSVVDIEVSMKRGKQFTKTAENILENYSENLVEIDQELERLITEIENRNEKTIVVFFGDHLPLLGSDYLVYREADYYLGDDSIDEYNRMFSVPLLIWDNFSGISDEIQIGAPLISSLTLERAELSGNDLTNYLLHHYRNGVLSSIPREDIREKLNLNQDVLQELTMLQYDILFGKMYSIEDKALIKPSEDYRLGYADPKIERVSENTIDGKKVLKIQGKNYTGRSYVYINNEYIAMESGDESEIIVPVPEGETELEIVINVMDSNNVILASSNIYKMEIED